MKDYFNAEEQAHHLAILACQSKAKTLREAKTYRTQEPICSKYERTCLKYAETYLNKFTESVFARMGEPYVRKLQSTLECNVIDIVGKEAPRKEAITKCAQEDLLPKIRELQALNCMWCERCDFKNCAMYAMGVAVGLEDKNETGCPFKM